MAHMEMALKAKDGAQVFAQTWDPDKPSRAVICLVHGLGEHSGRYTHLAEYLNRSGLAVMAFDLRGHGQTPGPRGHVDSFETFMADIDLLLAQAGTRYPSLPRFLYGQSLGSLLVLNYILRRQPDLDGVIASSPGLHTPLIQQKGKIAIARLLSSIWPSLTLPTGLDVRGLSRDPGVIQAYTADPLVHARASTRFTKCALESIPYAFEHAAEFHLPLLLMHGTGDTLTYHTGSQEFARLVPGDITLKLWEGLSHELHNEPEKEQVLNFMLNWIETRLESEKAED